MAYQRPPEFNPRRRRLEEYEQLKRKNRRRLVGAILLALVVGLILWSVSSKSQPEAAPEAITVEDSGDNAALKIEVAASETTAEQAVNAADDDAPAADEPVAPKAPENVVVTALPNPLNQAAKPEQSAIKPQPAAKSPAAAPVPQTKSTEPSPAPSVKAPAPVVTINNQMEEKATPARQPGASNNSANTSKRNETAVRQTPSNSARQNNRNSNRPLTPQEILNNRAAKQAAPSQNNPQAILDGKANIGGRAMIQVGAYTSDAQAREVQNRLAQAGVSAYVVQGQTSHGTLYRVRTGSYANRAAANNALEKIKAQGLDGMILTQ